MRIALKIILIFVSLIIIKYYWKKWTDKCNAKKTIIQYNQNEQNLLKGLPDVMDGINDYAHNGISYVFWTGGYDSTFRICQLLLLENKIVQPIYIMCGNTDDDVKLFDSIGFFGVSNQAKRNNVDVEKKKMFEIRLELNKQYPEYTNRLLPTWYIINLQKNIEVSNKYRNIHRYLGFFSRDITQYERMARFSLEMNLPMEICVESCGTGMDKATEKVRIGIGDSCRVPIEHIPINYIDMIIFRNLRFPIVHLTKEDMKMISLKNGFYSILKMSWSCWFPINGNPCGECKMCKERII